MSHVKSQGSKAHQGVNIRGKRLGLKVASGEIVREGNIIVRQRGTVIHPGKNTKLGRDFTIFATKAGEVTFKDLTGFKRGKKIVNVVESK